MQDEPILKIEIPDEEDAPFVPEVPAHSGVTEQVNAAGRQVAQTAVSTAKKAWDSQVRKRVTDGATAVAGKTARVVQDKMVKTAEAQAKAQMEAVQTRIRETDWKHEAQSGTARGLRWLSRKLAQLAERFTPQDEGSSAEEL